MGQEAEWKMIRKGHVFWGSMIGIFGVAGVFLWVEKDCCCLLCVFLSSVLGVT